MQSSDLLAQLQAVEQRHAAARNYEAAQAANEAAQAIGALRAKLKNLAHEESSYAASRDYAGAASAASAAKKVADDLQVEEARVCKQFDLVTGAAPVPPMATPVPPMATATPVGPVATPVPVSYGAPVQQPVAMPVVAPVQVPHAVPVQPGPVGTSGWLAGLCECDCCSCMCCASLFFPFFPLGQLRQRVLGRSCKGFVFVVILLYAVYSCLFSAGENLSLVQDEEADTYFEGCFEYDQYEYHCNYDPYGRCDEDEPYECYDTEYWYNTNINPALYPLVSIAGACGFVASLLMLLTACKVRAKLRRDHNIVGSCCGDCCTTLWCMPCSLFQMLRQVGVKVHTYEFCSRTGTGRGQNNELSAPIVVVDNHP